MGRRERRGDESKVGRQGVGDWEEEEAGAEGAEGAERGGGWGVEQELKGDSDYA